jgi:hypothetical protein
MASESHHIYHAAIGLSHSHFHGRILCCTFCRRRFCFDPDFNTKLWLRQRVPKFYFCVMSVLGSCGRTSRLDVADPGKARREAAEVMM